MKQLRGGMNVDLLPVKKKFLAMPLAIIQINLNKCSLYISLDRLGDIVSISHKYALCSIKSIILQALLFLGP